MRIEDLSTWEALIRAVPAGDLAGAAVRRLVRRGGIRPIRRVTDDEARKAAAALAQAPRVLAVDRRGARALYRLIGGGAAQRARRRTERILAGTFEVFGRPVEVRPGRIDWHVDPISGRRFDPTAPSEAVPILEPGVDARAAWEIARGAHLVALGVGAVLHADLGRAARRAILDGIEDFARANPPGRGVHWASPLEAGLRAVAFSVALELARMGEEAAPLDEEAVRPAAAALLEHGRFLAANREDRGLVPGSHLLGALVGELAAGVALSSLPEGRVLCDRALAKLPAEAARQSLPDGGPFEGSTAYHRFTLELLVWADRIAAAAGRDLGLGPQLRRMFRFACEVLGPDGSDPAIGDGDDSALLPPSDRGPRDHRHLAPLGAALTGEAALGRADDAFCEEAIWLTGRRGYRRARDVRPLPPRRVACYPTGGVHVLRDGGSQVLLRCGPHGQHGVGGHAHGDQLSLVVFLDGAPLLVDAGSYCYTRDPLWRDRFRGTGAHSTVVVDDAEQTPIVDARPFALPEGSAARVLGRGDGPDGAWLEGEARLGGAHGAYRHRREVVLRRGGGAVLVRDTITGPGSPMVEARFHLGEVSARLATEQELALVRVAIAEQLGGTADLSVAVLLGREGAPTVAVVPLGESFSTVIDSGWTSPRWGERAVSTVLRVRARTPLPSTLAVAMISMRARGIRGPEADGHE